MNKLSSSASSSRETAISAHTVAEVAIKHLANQPTVGLYYVSQHVRSSVPALAENADTLQAVNAKAQALTRNTDELTECGNMLTGTLPGLCTTLLGEVRAATSGVADLNAAVKQQAAAASLGGFGGAATVLGNWQWSSRR